MTSTWYSMAAIDRRASDTSRVLVTRTVRPPGERHSVDAAQDAGAQVERAAVVDDLAVVEVERRVLDQQPDQLAVGDVDDRLALLGEAVAGLGVGQRPLLEEAVEVRAGDDDRLALLERSAHADVPVGQREHRLVHAERGVVEADLGQRPRLDRERRPPLGHDSFPHQLLQVGDDDVGAGSLQCRGLPDPVHPDDEAEARPPGPPPRRRSRPRRPRPPHGSTPSSPRAGQEGVRLRLAAQPSRAATTPSMRTSIRSANPPAAMTFSPLAEAVTTAVARPASFTARR